MHRARYPAADLRVSKFEFATARPSSVLRAVHGIRTGDVGLALDRRGWRSILALPDATAGRVRSDCRQDATTDELPVLRNLSQYRLVHAGTDTNVNHARRRHMAVLAGSDEKSVRPSIRRDWPGSHNLVLLWAEYGLLSIPLAMENLDQPDAQPNHFHDL